MDISQTVKLYVTFVEKEGPFLKVWGQTEKNNAIYIEQFLLGASQQFDQGVGQVEAESLHIGTLICAKYKDNKYYRARIINTAFIREGFIEVTFLDYGNKDVVPCGNIRSLQNFPSSFISIPPLAIGFIFAEAHCVGGGEWNDTIFENISKEIKYRDVQCKLLAQATNYYLVKLFIEGTDLCSLLIQRCLMQPISLQAQQAVLLSMTMQKPSVPPPQTVQASSEINTYKTCTLESGCLYPVYVSYVNDGPCHFSVQLKQSEEVLVVLMKDINSIVLKPFDELPIPGTICLARCQEDNNICRAVVTNEVDNQFKVFFVDFGNYEVVPLDSLFQIPFKYVLPKVMAIRFALAGIEKPTVTLEMQCAFKKFVDNRLLHMKVLPSPTRMAIAKCELFDPETKTNALDVLKRAAKHAYPDPISLNRGFSQLVKVSYVYSCNRFFVQLVSKEEELTRLMIELQDICLSNELMDPSTIKVGLPCCALFEADQQWYRSQVVETLGDKVKVRYIDYGNEEVVLCSQLKTIDGEQLTVLRPQAIECCLNGYQNMDDDEERDGLLEEIILDGNFTMKIVEMFGKKSLVELFDTSNYNVASLLLDKLAAAKSQVSPLLVQAGNKIEHRKSFSQNGPKESTFRQERKPRCEDSWENKTNDRNDTTWRQDNKEFRNYEKNSNENDNTNSWRQNNKGFSPDNQRFSREKSDDAWNATENTINNNFGMAGKRKSPSANRDTWDNSNKNDDASSDDWHKDRRNDFSHKNRFDSDKSNRFGGKANDGGFRKKPDYRKDGSELSSSGSEKSFNRGPRTSNRNDWADRGDRSDSMGRSDRGGRGGRSDWDGRGGRGGRSDGGDRGGRGGRSDWGDRGGRGGRSDWTDRGDRGGRSDWSDRGGRGGRSDWSDRGGRGGRNDWGDSSGDRGGRGGFGDRGGRGGRGGRSDRGDRSNRFENNFDTPRDTSFSTASADDNSWNVSAVPSIDAAPVTASFVPCEVVGTEARVIISWFHNPGHFFCQVSEMQDQFKALMEEIQQFYKSRKPELTVVGAPIIGLFPEDNVLYRGQVLEVIGNRYKVYYVDFGNVSTIDKIWPIDKKFMALPAQAIVCSLNGIGPPGDKWPDPDNYSKYFEKENFSCRFLNKDENKTYVSIFDETEDIAQLLIRDGLAVSTETTIPIIEIPLLLGQQFRAILKSVNNLSDIIIALECGLAVSCAMHNLATATETFDETLKSLLEQTVIVYVDNVIDDRLEITLYDTEGTKLVILEPDEEAYDNLEPICPMLILCSTIKGYVSYVDERSIFIQPSEYAELIIYLLEQMFESYDTQIQESTIIPEEGQMYAVHSEDNNWYRGKVVSFDDAEATVFYIDYGNSENVAFSELRELNTKFMEFCMLCVRVTVSCETAALAEKEVTANIFYGENGWEGTVQLIEPLPIESTAAEQPDENAVTSLDKLTPVATEETCTTNEVELVESRAPAEESELSAEATALPAEAEEAEGGLVPEVIAEQQGTLVFMSHIDSPNDFYLQFYESLGEIEELQANLQEQAPTMPVLDSPAAGILCAAPYSADQQWYRAEILDADDDITTVRFVDFGNTDVIDNKTTQIKTLPPNLLSLAVHATRCGLKVNPVDEEWSSVAMGLFETITVQDDLTAEFFDQDEKKHFVDLYTDGYSITDILIQEKLAVAANANVESKSTCFVSHLNSPSEFWIQLENCIDELEWIAEQLSSADSFSELEDLAPGTLCAALFPEDQMWYRARILSNTVAGLELLFIDYGNSCTSNNLRKLPEDLLLTAPLAQKCSLQKPDGILSWSPEAAIKFKDISAEGQTIFTVRKISTGETSVVQLLLDGEDVTARLIPTTEIGRVVDVESLESFRVEKDGEILPETYKLETVNGAAWNDESVDKFEDLNKQGSTMFQIEFLNDNTVRLYLDGNDIRLQLEGTKTPPLNVMLIEDNDNINLKQTLQNEKLPGAQEINNEMKEDLEVIEYINQVLLQTEELVEGNVLTEDQKKNKTELESSSSDPVTLKNNDINESSDCSDSHLEMETQKIVENVEADDISAEKMEFIKDHSQQNNVDTKIIEVESTKSISETPFTMPLENNEPEAFVGHDSSTINLVEDEDIISATTKYKSSSTEETLFTTPLENNEPESFVELDNSKTNSVEGEDLNSADTKDRSTSNEETLFTMPLENNEPEAFLEHESSQTHLVEDEDLISSTIKDKSTYDEEENISDKIAETAVEAEIVPQDAVLTPEGSSKEEESANKEQEQGSVINVENGQAVKEHLETEENVTLVEHVGSEDNIKKNEVVTLPEPETNIVRDTLVIKEHLMKEVAFTFQEYENSNKYLERDVNNDNTLTSIGEPVANFAEDSEIRDELGSFSCTKENLEMNTNVDNRTSLSADELTEKTDFSEEQKLDINTDNNNKNIGKVLTTETEIISKEKELLIVDSEDLSEKNINEAEVVPHKEQTAYTLPPLEDKLREYLDLYHDRSKVSLQEDESKSSSSFGKEEIRPLNSDGETKMDLKKDDECNLSKASKNINEETGELTLKEALVEQSGKESVCQSQDEIEYLAEPTELISKKDDHSCSPAKAETLTSKKSAKKDSLAKSEAKVTSKKDLIKSEPSPRKSSPATTRINAQKPNTAHSSITSTKKSSNKDKTSPVKESKTIPPNNSKSTPGKIQVSSKKAPTKESQKNVSSSQEAKSSLSTPTKSSKKDVEVAKSAKSKITAPPISNDSTPSSEKIMHDDRILPGSLSRSDMPAEDNLKSNEDVTSDSQ